jgi:hypothetical protein
MAFLAGAVLAATVFVAKRDASSARYEPPPSLGNVPSERPAVLVLKWLLENHPDARYLKFIAWSPPEEVSDNPFTKEPCVRVATIFQNHQNKEPSQVEEYLFYVKDEKVLGSTFHHRPRSLPSPDGARVSDQVPRGVRAFPQPGSGPRAATMQLIMLPG